MVLLSQVDFGSFLRGLREERRLSRRQLATRAKTSEELIYEAEKSNVNRMRTSSAGAILDSLEHFRPLTPEQLNTYLDATGLSETYVVAQRLIAEQRAALTQTPSPTPAKSADHARAHALMNTLLDAHGPANVIQLLEAAAKMAGLNIGSQVQANAANNQAAPRTLRAHQPPVQRDGYSEQIITEYEIRKPENTKPIPRAKPKGA